jgi:hypothetical protein
MFIRRKQIQLNGSFQYRKVSQVDGAFQINIALAIADNNKH